MKANPVNTLRKRNLVTAQVEGRQSASSSSLARSFGLPVGDVKYLLRTIGVSDDDDRS